MSERMIELQRAKLGLPPIASPSGQASATSLKATAGQVQPLAALKPQPKVAAASAPRLTPQQAAAAAVYNQEKQLQTFLHRLQRREDEHASTVPSALSRRMLHRQGVGYLDDSVASVVSATADRFLATVLQQAVACRDQRLKGMEMAREEERHRRKHVLQHQADADDRKRRKLARREARQKSNLEAVAAADRLKAAGILPNTATAMASPVKSRKKKKKGDNGDLSDDDDEESYDSLDEEEHYYQDYYGDGNDAESDDEDENREMLTLRDLQRPLEAWDVHLTGKVGLGVVVGEASDVESDNEEEEEDVKMNGASEHKNKEEEEDEAQPSPAGKKSPVSKGGAKEVATDKTNGTPSAKSKADSKAPSPSPKKP